ncbi:MAG: HesA/MoeB/ThiF family protein [Armatimonadetes bacterium]|nr:HesA/MoeB/ThiF family protein [Armatimonadota bacterium]MDW8027011.1 HesA/MoeB/ThiF family protein [Armatimonadota bacterium]
MQGHGWLRYHRQMLLKGWGEEGQRKLSNAHVAIVGVGGLGCPVALYLTAAGVGTLTLVDADAVEETNLNRQILHWQKDIGKPKVQSAVEKLLQFNPNVKIFPVHGQLKDETIEKWLRDANIIVDALDNFPTRLILNRYAVRTRKPLVHGAIYGWEGRATTILPYKTACLTCVFEEGPPPGVFPVVGTTPGTIAMIQATEVLKLLLGIGQPLLNRYLIYDGLMMTFHTVKIRRRPNCPVCGKF